MKNKILIIIYLFLASESIAQELDKAKSYYRGAEDLKSGNYKDILTSFFQLGLSDLTGENKSFEFKSTLFGIKLRADSTLLVDKNYVNQTFARNFQFNFKINTDDDFKPTSYNAGFTYAIINGRDKTLADFRKTKVDSVFSNYMDYLSVIIGEYIEMQEEANRGPKMVQLQEAIDQYHLNGDTTKFSAEFKSFFHGKSGHSNNIDHDIKKYISNEANHVLDSLIKFEYKEMEKKPLWTFSASSATDNVSKAFTSLSFETIYLQGLPNDKFEADIRAGLNIKDTIANPKDNLRSVFNGKAGINLNLLRSKADDKHLIELKLQVEYNRILNGLILKEEEELFLANAEFRIRLTDQLWLPLTLKYDPENSNVFGVINIAWNMDVFRNFITGSNKGN